MSNTARRQEVLGISITDAVFSFSEGGKEVKEAPNALRTLHRLVHERFGVEVYVMEIATWTQTHTLRHMLRRTDFWRKTGIRSAHFITCQNSREFVRRVQKENTRYFLASASVAHFLKPIVPCVMEMNPSDKVFGIDKRLWQWPQVEEAFLSPLDTTVPNVSTPSSSTQAVA